VVSFSTKPLPSFRVTGPFCKQCQWVTKNKIQLCGPFVVMFPFFYYAFFSCPAHKFLYWFGKVARKFPPQAFGKPSAGLFTLTVLSVPLYASRTTESALTESEILLPSQYHSYAVFDLHPVTRFSRAQLSERASFVVYVLSYFWRQNRTTVAVRVYTNWEGVLGGYVAKDIKCCAAVLISPYNWHYICI